MIEAGLLIVGVLILLASWVQRPHGCRWGHAWTLYAPQPDYVFCERCEHLKRRRRL